MPKERKPGWIYFKNEVFGEFAYHQESGWVFFADGTKYSPGELMMMEKAGLVFDPVIHRLKRILGIGIVSIENDDGIVSAMPGKSVLANQVPKQGELEIF